MLSELESQNPFFESCGSLSLYFSFLDLLPTCCWKPEICFWPHFHIACDHVAWHLLQPKTPTEGTELLFRAAVLTFRGFRAFLRCAPWCWFYSWRFYFSLFKVLWFDVCVRVHITIFSCHLFVYLFIYFFKPCFFYIARCLGLFILFLKVCFTVTSIILQKVYNHMRIIAGHGAWLLFPHSGSRNRRSLYVQVPALRILLEQAVMKLVPKLELYTFSPLPLV